mmetsp:Transcript_32620/g.81124  ORF Transcript_32620/g.81124 Transcript_32620/m.81124 type:complete len:241 (+) Transcript_32620:952-1674(+)
MRASFRSATSIVDAGRSRRTAGLSRLRRALSSAKWRTLAATRAPRGRGRSFATGVPRNLLKVVGNELPELEVLCLPQMLSEFTHDSAALVKIAAKGFAAMPRLRTLLLNRDIGYYRLPPLTPEALTALFAAIFQAAPALESFDFDQGRVTGNSQSQLGDALVLLDSQPRLGNALVHSSPPRSLTRLHLSNVFVIPSNVEGLNLSTPNLRFLCFANGGVSAQATFNALKASLPAGQLKWRG